MNPLTPQQQRVLTMLATGNPIDATAQAVGIHRNTIANWRRSSALFRETFLEMQQEQCAYWRDQALPLAADAIQTIHQLMNDFKSSDSVRLRAALAIYRQVSTPPPVEKTRPSREPHLGDFMQELKRPRTRIPLTPESDSSAPPAAGLDDVQTAQDAHPCTTDPDSAQDAHPRTTEPAAPEGDPDIFTRLGDLESEDALDLLESMVTPPIRPPFPH